MKTLKLKTLIVTTAASLILMIGIPGSVFSGVPGTTDFQRDNAAIREDISAIKYYRQQVNQLKLKFKKDREAGRQEAMILDNRDLMKAEADFERHNEYLAADKKALVLNHKLAVKSWKGKIKTDQANLNSYRNKLEIDIAKGNETALNADASKVIQYQNEIRNDNARLNRERENLNTELTAINNEIKRLNGQNVPVTGNETAYLNYSNKANK